MRALLKYSVCFEKHKRRQLQEKNRLLAFTIAFRIMPVEREKKKFTKTLYYQGKERQNNTTMIPSHRERALRRHLGLDVFRSQRGCRASGWASRHSPPSSGASVFFHRDRDDLPGLSSLAGLRSPWSNIQQLGQEYSLLHPHRVLTIYRLCCAAQVRIDGHRKHF